MTTITTTVPFPTKDKHIDINILVKKYVDYVVEKEKKAKKMEINFWKKWVNAKEVLAHLKK